MALVLPNAAVIPVRGKKYSFVVTFFSPGNGTDYDAFLRLLAVVGHLPKGAIHASGSSGHEGEHDECFDLARVPADERRAFIEDVKRALVPSTRTLTKENAICEHRYE